MLSRRGLLIGAGSLGAGALLPSWPLRAAVAADWPQFRGPLRDKISRETGLARKWPAGGPKRALVHAGGPGYAAQRSSAAFVYHEDYDEKKSEWRINCRNLADWQAGMAVPRRREDPAEPRHHPRRSRRGRALRLLDRSEGRAALPERKDGQAGVAQEPGTDYKATIPPGTTASVR